MRLVSNIHTSTYHEISRKLLQKEFSIGFLLNFNDKERGGFSIKPLLIQLINDNKQYIKIPFVDHTYLELLRVYPKPFINIFRNLTDDALIQKLIDNGAGYLQHATEPLKTLKKEERNALTHIYRKNFEALYPYFSAMHNVYYLANGQALTNVNIKPAFISNYVPQLFFEIIEKEKGYTALCHIILNGRKFSVNDFTQTVFLLQSKNEFYIPSNKDIAMLTTLQQGYLLSNITDKDIYLQKVVKPLEENYKVDSTILLPIEYIEEAPKNVLQLGELSGKFLMLTPKWIYQQIEVEDDGKETQRLVQDDIQYIVKRDSVAEINFKKDIVALHPKFAAQKNGYYYLPFENANAKQWFAKFYEAILAMDVQLQGLDNLKHFNVNPNKPTITFTTTNRIDWFDLKIEVTYGNIVLPLSTFKKALMQHQRFILLPDGSLGLIPTEWVEKYTPLMHMGQHNNEVISVNKRNMMLWDNLADNIAHEKLHAEMKAMKQRLRTQALPNDIVVPNQIKVSLRDYQKQGFDWLCTLDTLGCGGCLADDMGLGKTLQTITFLQHIINTKKLPTHMVIVPTSLLYNWEAELKKFAPEINYTIVYGSNRTWKDIQQYQLVITSYGTIRNDLDTLLENTFGYIILDESHAIKNPSSIIYRSVTKLKSYSNIVLSGTPVQNNSVDIYAQMHFVNKFLLGDINFFKEYYATPIDKYGDANKAAELQKIIAPFILRRTKEQVAKDLPDKTETIMYCTMGPAQQKVYDTYKEHYRKILLDQIDAEGLDNSRFSILAALTKLRQICDSPALLKEEVAYPNDSIKIEELLTELKENVGNHKVLVFSQFTSMLALIKSALDAAHIAYAYLDGSTKAAERQQLVNSFQIENTANVFLISLKAGGVGLNLTSADYVYIVDPWWNPAAEAQAIDRTHRIGQTKKVFAYKMICKDTVEEKILILQQKKKELMGSLLVDDSGIAKKLTVDDINYLFS
jgi:superfamily II DNA or RNA helicase